MKAVFQKLYRAIVTWSRSKRFWPDVARLITLLVAIGCTYGAYSLLGADKTESIDSPVSQMRKGSSAWMLTEKDVSTLLADIKGGRVRDIGLGQNVILVTTAQSEKYSVLETRYNRVSDAVLGALKDAREHGVAPRVIVLPHTLSIEGVMEGPQGGSGGGFLNYIVNLLSIIVLVSILLAQLKDRFGGFKPVKTVDTRFSDVIGAGEAKAALMDVAEYLKHPEKFERLGVKQMAGVMMAGGPGTGKTLLAKALAGECGVPFISITGSAFSSKWVGVGVMMVKALFATARRNAPCIVFIDEIDGVGKRQEDGTSVSTENNRIINQILAEMNGFSSKDGVIVIAATNLMELVDPALARDGRFDRKIQVQLPDVKDREALFKLYAAALPCASDIDFAQLARLTAGKAPASIATITNQAAILAAKTEGEPVITGKHYLTALETHLMGDASHGQTLTEKDRERVAVHEAGHVLVAKLLNSGVVEKVSILPRGAALGVTLVTPEDKHLYLRSELTSMIEVALGGRCAEILCFGEASSGAANDLQNASAIALRMVSEYGLGDDGTLFSVGAISNIRAADLRPEIEKADVILRKLEVCCMERLMTHRHALDRLAAALLANETLDADAIETAIHPREPAL